MPSTLLFAMLDPKKQLDITLTEPVVFLRSSDPSGRLQSDPDDAPTLVRGILTLTVVKPIEVSSIEVELAGVLTVSYSESSCCLRFTLHEAIITHNFILITMISLALLLVDVIASRHNDFPEKHKIYSSTMTVFCADQVSHGKRRASVGPGLSAANSANDDEHVAANLSRLSSLSRWRSERRSAVSAYPFTPPAERTRLRFAHVGCSDGLLSRLVAVTGAPLDLGPTPPYTPVTQLPLPAQPRQGESSARTLEELRQALRDHLQGQAHRNELCEQIRSLWALLVNLSFNMSHV